MSFQRQRHSGDVRLPYDIPANAVAVTAGSTLFFGAAAVQQDCSNPGISEWAVRRPLTAGTSNAQLAFIYSGDLTAGMRDGAPVTGWIGWRLVGESN